MCIYFLLWIQYQGFKRIIGRYEMTSWGVGGNPLWHLAYTFFLVLLRVLILFLASARVFADIQFVPPVNHPLCCQCFFTPLTNTQGVCGFTRYVLEYIYWQSAYITTMAAPVLHRHFSRVWFVWGTGKVTWTCKTWFQIPAQSFSSQVTFDKLHNFSETILFSVKWG